MAVIRIYGYKGMVIAKPFEINSVDDDPEVITEEENIINSSASDSDKQVDEVADGTGS